MWILTLYITVHLLQNIKGINGGEWQWQCIHNNQLGVKIECDERSYIHVTGAWQGMTMMASD